MFGTLFTTFLILMIFYMTFLTNDTQAWVFWVVTAFALLFGLVGGYLMMKMERVGCAMMAGWAGFNIGLLLNESCLYLFLNTKVFWSTTWILAFIAFVLGFMWLNQGLIVSTAINGSFLVMKGFGTMLPGFPNNRVLIDQVASGGISVVPPGFYGYLAAIVLMSVVCAVV